MKVKAKFKCNSVTNYENGKDANLTAVYGTNGENADFTKYTPNGNLTMSISSDTPASDFFEAGKEYFLTFEKANLDS